MLSLAAPLLSLTHPLPAQSLASPVCSPSSATQVASLTDRRSLLRRCGFALSLNLLAPHEARAAGFAEFAEERQQESKSLQAEREERAASAAKAAAEPRAPPRVTAAAGEAVVASPAPTDEFSVDFSWEESLGLTLRDLRVGFELGTREGTSRVLVADVMPGGPAAREGRVEIDNIVVSVDGVNVEKENVQQVIERINRVRNERRMVSITFKDPLAFNARLSDIRGEGDPKELIATVVAPASESQPAQIFSVKRLDLPDRCRSNAQSGDLVEIRYTGRLADGSVFDGMELGKRFADDSIQFVLGKQPAGQFPPAWDVGLVGMCVGERRRLNVPPVLGFGAKGLPKRGIPPNARLIYEIELLSINGVASI